MNSTRALLLALVAICGAIGATVAVAQPVAPPGGHGGPGGAEGPADAGSVVGSAATDAQGPPNASRNNTSMGSQISSFMQTSSASTEGSVDNGVWAAQVNGSDDATKRQLVEGRTAALENRLEALYDRKARLIEQYENGTISEVAYEAQMSRIAGEIAAIESALNQTEPVAREVGANVSKIEQLRTEASNLSGPEVAAVARNISGFNPGFAGERGNSTRGGGQGAGAGQGGKNVTGGQGNASVGQNVTGGANGTVDQGNVTGGQGNATGGGENVTGGSGNGTGNGTGAGGGGGGGTGSGGGGGTGSGGGGGTGSGGGPDGDTDAGTTDTYAADRLRLAGTSF